MESDTKLISGQWDSAIEQDSSNNAELEDNSGTHSFKDDSAAMDANTGVLVKRDPSSIDSEDKMEETVGESDECMETEDNFDEEIFMRVEINNDGEIHMETVEAFDDEVLEQVENSGAQRVQVKVEEEEKTAHSSPVSHATACDLFTCDRDAETAESGKGSLGDMQAVKVMNSTLDESCPRQTFREEGLTDGAFKSNGTPELAVQEHFMESQVICKHDSESSDPGEMQASFEINNPPDRIYPQPTFAVEGLTSDRSARVGAVGLAVGEQSMEGPVVWKAEPGGESQTWSCGEESVPTMKVERADEGRREEGQQQVEGDRGSGVHPVFLVVHCAVRQKGDASHAGEGSSVGRKGRGCKHVGTRARGKQDGPRLLERSSVDGGRRGSKYMCNTARQTRSTHFTDGSSVEGGGKSSEFVRNTQRQKHCSSLFAGESSTEREGRGGKHVGTRTSSSLACAGSRLQQAHSEKESRSALKTNVSSSSGNSISSSSGRSGSGSSNGTDSGSSGSSSSEIAEEIANVACQANLDVDDYDDDSDADDDEEEEEDKTLYCPHCLYECEDDDDLQRHIRTVHMSRGEHHTKLRISGQTGMQFIVVEPCETKQAYKSSLKEGKTAEPPSRELPVRNIGKKCAVVKPIAKKHVITDTEERSSDDAKKFACPSCDFRTIWKSNLTRHMATAHKNMNYSCPLCSKRYSSESDMKVHVAVAHEHLKNACSHCDYRSKLKGSLRRHIRMVHGGPTKCQSPQRRRKGRQQGLQENDSPQSKPKHQQRHPVKSPAESTPQDVEKSQCPCEEKVAVKRCVKPVKKIQCPRCAFKCSQMSELQAHIQRRHSCCMRLQCPQCDYRCELESVMERHRARKHGGSTKFLCHHCEFQTEQDSELLIHMKTQHSGQKDHKCPHCDYSSIFSSHLESHVRSKHGGVKKHQCPHCKVTYSQKGSLNRHMDTVHGDQKKYKCPHCDYRSGLRWNVNKHIENVHMRSQKHQCPHCKFWSWYKRTLRQHVENLHHSQKKYQCSQCDFGSVHKSYLQAHVESVHEGIKRHSCPHCHYKSAHKWNLKVHIDRIHV